jgi:hypothetical protein
MVMNQKEDKMHEWQNRSQIRDERGVSLITVMMVILIMTLMGISILAVTGFERQIAGSVTASEASTDAAESCVSTGVNVLYQYIENGRALPPVLLANAVPPGPVPLANLAVLNSELTVDGGNPDVPIGAGSAPNLTMTIGNYQVFGDIDRMYFQCAPGSDCTDPQTARFDYFYQITCVAQNLATGINSQVDALYACNFQGSFCQRRGY